VVKKNLPYLKNLSSSSSDKGARENALYALSLTLYSFSTFIEENGIAGSSTVPIRSGIVSLDIPKYCCKNSPTRDVA
jgi:hypothetical protein